MAVRQHSSQDFLRRANEIYERDVRPALRPQDADKFIAIDIDSAAYEIDATDIGATERLLAKRPNAQVWLGRVGQRAAYRIGGRGVAGVSE